MLLDVKYYNYYSYWLPAYASVRWVDYVQLSHGKPIPNCIRISV